MPDLALRAPLTRSRQTHRAPEYRPMQAKLLTRFSILIAILVAGLLLNACAPVKERVPEAAEAAAAAKAAELEQAGDYEAAAQAYLALAEAVTAPAKQQYQLQAALAFVHGNMLPRAKALLDQIDTSNLDPSFKTHKDLITAEIALAEERPEQALQLLPPLSPEAPRALRIHSRTLRALAYLALGNYVESVRERILLEPLLEDPSAIDENRKAIWTALSQMSPLALQQLQTAPPPDILSGWMELAYIFKTAALEPAQLETQLQAWRTRYPEHPATGPFLDELLARQQQLQRRPAAIALLLPLSGNLGGAGTAIRDGFLAAHYSLGQQDEKTVIRVYDTTAGGGDIWTVYKRAVEDGAAFIVGPLTKETVSALARAGQLDVPALALNFADDADTQTPQNLYQFGLSPEDEARQVAERASIDGLTHAVAIVPEGDWGSRVIKAFSERFQQLGGQVLQQERYNGADSDFSAPIRQMLNLDQSRDRYNLLRRITGRDIKFEPRRRKDVDFVFMAAFPRQARLIAPQLRFYHAADLPVYATSHAYTGVPDSRDDRDMDGVTFCDTPWTLAGADAEPLRQTIAQAWPQSMENYARLLALGVDAYNILPYLEWLKHEPYERFAGETGSLYIDANNRIHRSLQWARFVGGNATIIREQIVPATATLTTDAHLIRGRQAEQLACRHLQECGLTVLERNYRSPAGELDLIMRHGDTLVFVEVRYRGNTRFGSGADTIDPRKQRKIIATAMHYLQRSRATNRPCRIDVVSITMGQDGEQLEWIQDAFQAA
jgi:uncharacterized protein (TIGR00252 family)